MCSKCWLILYWLLHSDLLKWDQQHEENWRTQRLSSSLNIFLQRSTVKWFFGTRLSSEAITDGTPSLAPPVKRFCNVSAQWSLTSSFFTYWGRCRSKPVHSHHLVPWVLAVWLRGIFQTKRPLLCRVHCWLLAVLCSMPTQPTIIAGHIPSFLMSRASVSHHSMGLVHTTPST